MFDPAADVSPEAASALAVTVSMLSVAVSTIIGEVVVLNQGATVPAAEVALLRIGPLLPKTIDDPDATVLTAVPEGGVAVGELLPVVLDAVTEDMAD